MAEAVELAALAGAPAVDAALGTAALADRFGDGDLLSLVGYQAVAAAARQVNGRCAKRQRTAFPHAGPVISPADGSGEGPVWWILWVSAHQVLL
jgi:hypothetical protein